MPAICRDADVLLNLSGANPIRPWLEQVPVRVLVDTDPAFTQVRHLTDPARRRQAEQHTAFFSYAENIGRGASIPDDGLPVARHSSADRAQRMAGRARAT